MGERERVGGRDGLLATQMISLSSLSFSFSRCVCAYISEREREREKTTTKRDRERGRSMRGSNFLFGLLPRGLSQNIFLSRLFRLFFLFFCFFRQRLPSFFLPKRAQKRKEEEEEEDFRLSFLFPSFFVCEINLSFRQFHRTTTTTNTNTGTKYYSNNVR